MMAVMGSADLSPNSPSSPFYDVPATPGGVLSCDPWLDEPRLVATPDVDPLSSAGGVEAAIPDVDDFPMADPLALRQGKETPRMHHRFLLWANMSEPDRSNWQHVADELGFGSAPMATNAAHRGLWRQRLAAQQLLVRRVADRAAAVALARETKEQASILQEKLREGVPDTDDDLRDLLKLAGAALQAAVGTVEGGDGAV
jgi:hypothetical protein